MRITRYVLIVLFFLVPISLSGCGDGDDDSSIKDQENVDTIDRPLNISGEFDSGYIRTLISKSHGENADDTPPLTPVDELMSGECGGELSIYSDGQKDSIGTYDVSFTFSEFNDCESKISGELVFSGEVDPQKNTPISSSVSFYMFTVINDEEEYSIDGTVSFDHTGEETTITSDLQLTNSLEDATEIISFGYGYSTINELAFYFGVAE